MTRTELIQIARRIKKQDTDPFPADMSGSMLYSSRYRKKPIYCVFRGNEFIALAYNGVCYRAKPYLGRQPNAFSALKQLANTHTIVWLCDEKNYLVFKDEYGNMADSKYIEHLKRTDYAEVIPIPYTP